MAEHLTSDGITLACTEQGGGEPPFLLVHGFAGAQLDWADVVGAIAAHRRVVTYDHRGHGDSTNAGAATAYTFERLVADLAEVADAYAPGPFHLLGHSMGGVVAMRYVLANPERVRSLVLMDTLPSPEGLISQEWVDGVTALARANGMAAVAAELTAYGIEGRSAERMAWKFEHMDVEAFDALARELNSFDALTPRLREIACPTTVLVGEDDAPLRASAETLASSIAGAHLVVIPGAGHNPQDENRDAWLAAVGAHFDRLDG